MMAKCLKINNTSEIIEGLSIGGIDFSLSLNDLKYTSTFRISCGYDIELSISNDLVLSLNFISQKVTVYYDIEFGQISRIKASSGYIGQWKDQFTAGNFRLSDLLKFDWKFEQMTPGMITSEDFKGIGFLIPNNIPEFNNFEGTGKEVSEMVKINDCLIEEIAIFPNFIGHKNLWDIYEPFIWDENIKNWRYENNYPKF